MSGLTCICKADHAYRFIKGRTYTYMIINGRFSVLNRDAKTWYNFHDDNFHDDSVNFHLFFESIRDYNLNELLSE
jgi:hypothetical protein